MYIFVQCICLELASTSLPCFKTCGNHEFNITVSKLWCNICLSFEIRKHSKRVLLFGHCVGHLALFGIKKDSVKVLLFSQCLVTLT